MAPLRAQEVKSVTLAMQISRRLPNVHKCCPSRKIHGKLYCMAPGGHIKSSKKGRAFACKGDRDLCRRSIEPM